MNTDASLVVLVGDNASGKTTFLEALNVLFYGRSFRTRHNSQLISTSTDGYLVRAKVAASERHFNGDSNVATSRRVKEDSRYRLDSEDVRPSELVRRFPIQLIDASIFDLIDGSPSDRRRFLDWGMFHVKHDFYPLWRKHRKLIAHWTALLKRGGSDPSDFDSWKPALVEISEKLAEMRGEYLEEVTEFLRKELASPTDDDRGGGSGDDGLADDSIFGGSVQLEFYQGWSNQDSERGYAGYIDQSLERDIKERRLRAGAHLFDFSLKLDGRPIKETFSRGQKKLFGLKLKLAQIKLYNSQPDKPSCIVLVDDLAAEVDAVNQRRAINELLRSGSQVFLTGIDHAQVLSMIPEGLEARMFHVKHGQIEEA